MTVDDRLCCGDSAHCCCDRVRVFTEAYNASWITFVRKFDKLFDAAQRNASTVGEATIVGTLRANFTYQVDEFELRMTKEITQ